MQAVDVSAAHRSIFCLHVHGVYPGLYAICCVLSLYLPYKQCVRATRMCFSAQVCSTIFVICGMCAFGL